MKTLPNIWTYITGLFPDATAKAASGTGAKDGTEWRTTAVEEFLLGPVQYLLTKVGQIPNGVSETKTASQIVSAYRELCATAEKQTINASGPVVFGKTNHEVEVDLSGGNISISALPVPDFIGQKVHIYGAGAGLGDIAGGTGLYANGVFFTENTGGVFLTAISLTEWRAENGVTADYDTGNWKVLRYSNGDMEQSEIKAGVTITSTGLGAVFYGSVTFTFGVAFANANYTWETFIINSAGRVWMGAATGTPVVASVSLYVIGAAITSSGNPGIKLKGKY